MFHLRNSHSSGPLSAHSAILMMMLTHEWIFFAGYIRIFEPIQIWSKYPVLVERLRERVLADILAV